jgi:metallo-beta-lactamase family protein
MSEVTVRSHGGAMTVTGSCHLLEAPGTRVLIDCGAFQGSEALFDLNRAEMEFDPSSIQAVLLTHAHLDHSGRLPLLVKRGFSGKIHALKATHLLAEHLLMDSAKIQMEDAERDRRKGRQADEPLYDDTDVLRTLDLFVPLEYGVTAEIGTLKVTPQVAGHIPGSASFLVEVAGKRLVFSGDVGNARKDVMPDPTPCPPADWVLMESTYGDRDHRDFDATIAEFAGVLNTAADRGGKILVPSFALERTQDVLYHLARLEDAHKVPVLPVYVDSPLAARVEQVYQECHDELSDEVKMHYRNGIDPFAPKHLRYTRSVEESKEINRSKEAAVIIAGSGMMSGGRILHHLRAHLDDPHTTVMIVGFQPHGGLGRRLVDGDATVRIMGQEIAVEATVATIGGLSAHADRTELLDWASGAGNAAEFHLNHGEVDVIEGLAKTLSARGQKATPQPSEVAIPGRGHREEAGE